jgi:Zn-dependent M28 family amino/carboxypeptidase
VKNCQSIVHINQSLNKVVLPEIRNVKGYLNFDMIGCNNNEKAYSYGLSLHESVPNVSTLNNAYRNKSIKLESYFKKSISCVR